MAFTIILYSSIYMWVIFQNMADLQYELHIQKFPYAVSRNLKLLEWIFYRKNGLASNYLLETQQDLPAEVSYERRMQAGGQTYSMSLSMSSKTSVPNPSIPIKLYWPLVISICGLVVT